MGRSVSVGKVVSAAVIFAVSAHGVVGASEKASGGTRPFTVKLQIDKPYCLLHFLETLRPIAHFLNSGWSPDIPVIVSFSIVPDEKIKLVPPR